MDELIYDRTQEDIDYAIEHWLEPGESLRGCHNYADINRIEEWCEYLAELLTSYGYPVHITTKTDWTMDDRRTESDMERIRQNIATIKNAYTVMQSTPQLPNTLNPIDIDKANAIEKILHDIDLLIKSMKQVFLYAGVARAGQNRVWQQRFRRPVEALNYKVFGNAEQATRSGINKLLSFAEGETSYFSNISNSYVNDTNYYKAVPLRDNWIHVECDFTDSSITGEKYINSFINKDKAPELKPSTRYTIIVEFRNVNKVSISTPFNFGATHENQIGTIWEGGNWAIGVADIVEGAKIIRNNYYTSATITKNDFLRNFHTIRQGAKFSYDYRISVVEGAVTEYDYEPYGVMPSPNYPSTVYGLGRNGAIGLKQKIGDNLLDISKLENGYVNTYNGYLVASQYTDTTDYIKLKANKKYIYTYDYENLAHTNDRGYGVYDLNKKFLWGADYTIASKKFEIIPTEDCYIRISIDKGCTNLMFNEGEPLPYIPFIEVNKYIDLINYEPLMKIGDVADYVDYENNRIVRRIGKTIFDGSDDENWTMTWATGLFDNQSAGLNFSTNNALCSHFIFNKIISGMNAGLKDGEFALQPQYENKPIFFKNLAFTTVVDWRTWLTNNPITVWYELAEPYYEDIDLPSIQKIPGEYSLTAYDEYLDGRVEKE